MENSGRALRQTVSYAINSSPIQCARHGETASPLDLNLAEVLSMGNALMQ